MADSDREKVADLLAHAADELRRAAAHLDSAADHFRNGDVPRGCAHAFAGQGHQSRAASGVDEATRLHADHSNV